MMDHHKLRSAVFEKTGIKIDTTDPIFALVALNEAVLEEMFQRHLHLLQTSHGVSSPEGQIRPALRTAMHDNWEQDDSPPPVSPPAPASETIPAASVVDTPPVPTAAVAHPTAPAAPQTLSQRVLVYAAGLGLASALLVVLGQALLQPGLSSEQKMQLQQAEKLRKALDKLDPKLKAQLPAEINQIK